MSERDPRAMRLTEGYLLLHVTEANIHTSEERMLVHEYRQKYKVRMELEQEERDFRSKNLGKKLGFFASLKHKMLCEKIRICINELTLMESDPRLRNLLMRERARSINEMNEESKRIQEEIKQRKIQENRDQRRRYQEESARAKATREAAQGNNSVNVGHPTIKSAVVWRNVNGQIACPGDVCPKECDDTCPIYINTQCLMLKKMGAHNKALELYKKALEIAPDFYDAYNNMAGIYGGQGRYQEAYNYFLKAHELNKVRPNPVYGLALCCRDLNRPEECIFWCEEYNRLATDNRLAELHAEMKARLGMQVAEQETDDDADYEVIQEGDEWSIVWRDNCYFFIGEDGEYATTPRGIVLKTSYLELAERILEDLEIYGPDDFSAESILPWHYTMVENFSQMKHKQVEDILADSFVNRYDWTYTIDVKDTKWKDIWGVRGVRESEIMAWLSKITHMQMTAACCIGNAYHSINIAYILAVIMETCDGEERDTMFTELAVFISTYSECFANVDDFKTFELYYGIHHKENGNVLP